MGWVVFFCLFEDYYVREMGLNARNSGNGDLVRNIHLGKTQEVATTNVEACNLHRFIGMVGRYLLYPPEEPKPKTKK